MGAIMTTLLGRHPEQYLQNNHFTWYLQYFPDVGPSCVVYKSTSGLCELEFRISEGFGSKRELGLGGAFRGMMTTRFRRHPEQYLHTLVRVHHTLLQKKTLLRQGLGFRSVGEPLPRTAGIFVFDAYKMLRFRF